MNNNRQLCVGLSLAVTWLTGNGWRRNDSDVESIYSSEFYVDIARRAEAAKLDFLFRPDAMWLSRQAVVESPAFSSVDPTLLMASIAAHTSRIGLVSTASTTFMPPYVVARQFQSLNQLSRGRAGWNVVTSLAGNLNFGLSEMPPSAQRYAQALEFTEVVRKLWRSYPAEALRIDREAGVYADFDKVVPIDHQGEHFSVQGPLNVPEWDGPRIPLFQAGASDSGRDFAARTADAIFAATPDIAAGVELRNDLRRRAVAHGRSADDIRLMPGVSLYLGNTREEAQELYRATQEGLDPERKFARASELLGINLRELSPDTRITPDMLPPPGKVFSQTHANLLRRLIEREQPLLRDLMTRPEVVGSAYWQVIGTVEDAVREIRERFEAGALDGIIAIPGGSPGCMDLTLSQLMPRLSEEGLLRREYSSTTLAGHLGIG
ncbi:NtaA/DmoA family FMN-dependent monooxygenase [Erwinia sp. S43]|uniref:LLM class flavin-dependent oxidoreductase n=1 Tax=Pantoea coffeiphila TaxID=1465635 RepID=A0A2S9IA11_9GAMM|nr:MULTISPECIES: NtaA/DmoA family FMN-dependent monooxygenase [Erwiniaceae]MBK0002002.1 NtaA/DmoA family FMN-dependent monooxygenase [Erwinia sp. S38]MBK0033105.1 NtaA/DmoA family FMN-dependent monooxygenase [Erwinia sp. S43]MBM7345609.1 FMN-dependent oxidoreductase (nitrilotriacetate monooxygenase family) [Pantoea coffeiphila]MCW1875823.1 NtaA/DmoA family FMN-dependent monooxygenase [Erwinia sp. INIA01]PRD14611.1 LLM class flavin-dependent oxidoreductase [Pantoea coffeiphila]